MYKTLLRNIKEDLLCFWMGRFLSKSAYILDVIPVEITGVFVCFIFLKTAK